MFLPIKLVKLCFPPTKNWRVFSPPTPTCPSGGGKSCPPHLNFQKENPAPFLLEKYDGKCCHYSVFDVDWFNSGDVINKKDTGMASIITRELQEHGSTPAA